MVKLLMTWDIREGEESSYMEFVVHELGPKLNDLGLTITDAWYTIAGEPPQVIIGGVVEDRESLYKIFQQPGWEELQQKLQGYVINYQQKIASHRGFFQL
ncbi:MAG: hypothetical protein JXA37_05250 [Chloroflexia bacterium]|nr:hypothetical protein [Chloroflexia bacterium]